MALGGVYDAIRWRIAERMFRPYKTVFAIGEHKISMNIADFEASTWYGPYRYRRIRSAKVEFDWILQNTKPDDIVYDIGAHQGLWSILFARSALQGVVHAFETSQHNVEIALKNLRENDITNVYFNLVFWRCERAPIYAGVIVSRLNNA